MKYFEFKAKFSRLPLININDIVPLYQNEQILRNQIHIWKERKLLIPLKRGVYVLNENDRKITPSREYIANQLVFPSYVSCEYVLSLYNIIPERVYTITSITSKKTMEYTNHFGVFSYRNLKAELFFGFTANKDENELTYIMAEKEKALIDFLYLNLSKIKYLDINFLNEYYRMENLDQMDKSKIKYYTQKYKSKKLITLIDNIFSQVVNGSNN
jgi:predicted transcriptional regulator of viral defense system